MQRNNRKKFRKFLETRRNRRRQGKAEEAPSYLGFEIFCAVLSPLLLGGAVALFWRMDFLFVLYWPVYAVAYGLLLVWAILAYRGAMHYWSLKFDFLFGVAFILLVGFGACWGLNKAVPVKAWVTPPDYARLPALELVTPSHGRIYRVLEGSTLHIAWQSEGTPPEAVFDGLTEKLESAMGIDVSSSLSVPVHGESRQDRLVIKRGWHKLANWNLQIVPDGKPYVVLLNEPEITLRKTIKFVYKALDDYGIETVAVRIAPTSSTSGVSTEPVEIVLEKPALKEIDGVNYADLTALPWAGIPVTAQLVVTDGAGHRGWSEPKVITLPTRSFRNPFARALIEERQKFVENPDAAIRDETANVMAGIARQQGLYRGDPVVLMALRAGAVRLVLNDDAQTVQAVSDILWKTAVRLEEGSVGQARADLADAQKELSFSLMRKVPMEAIQPFVARVRTAMTKYFDALEEERARQPPALQEMDWPLATASEMLTPEDLYARLTVVTDRLTQGNRAGALETLASLQSLIENLRTTPPELTPDQAQMAQQVFAMRALVREQKSLVEEVEGLTHKTDHSPKARKAQKNELAHSLAQQQMLLSALKEIISRQGSSFSEAEIGASAMSRAIAALQKESMAEAKESQLEALAQMEKGLTVLTEAMRRAMTAKAP
ncbi:MAG: DUF4175 family protein [Bdellovibrionales bacterium]